MPPAPQFDPLGGTVAGSNDLQASLDRLNQSVVSLSMSIQGMTNGNGTTTSPAMASQAQGATFTTGGFGAGNNGSGGTTGTNPYSMGGSSGGGLGSILGGASGAFSATQVLANLASSAYNVTTQQGVNQLNPQAQINTYGYTQAGFWNVSSQSAIGTNFGGTTANGLQQNNMANNVYDARQGGTVLSQMEGQANYTGGAGRGNNPFQATAGIAMANPGLGMTGSAGVAGALFNPNTSYNMMMMGINTTPLQLGTGKANSLTSVEGSIGQRFNIGGYNSKTGTFGSQSLAANLDNPLFQSQMMQATGMTQDQYTEWSQSWAQANTWTQKAGNGVTMNQMQNEIADYMNGGPQQSSATKWLQSHGVSQSMLQSINQTQAGQTATQAGGDAAFVSGLQTATKAINTLTNQLAKGIILQAGVQGAAGGVAWGNSNGISGAGGAGGTMGTIASSLISMGATMAGIGNSIDSTLGVSSGVTASGGNASGSNAANEAMGKRLAAGYGWTGSQWTALNNVEMREAGWNNRAQNPTSTAYGIGQFLDSTWQTVGYTKTSDAQTQIEAMLKYIKQRYGNPTAAWQHEQNYNWYSAGTSSAKAGVAMVGERGPELVKLSGGQQIMDASKTAQAVQAPWTTGQTAQHVFSPITSSGGGGVSIVFDKGSISFSSGTGYHTSADVNTQAQQFVQALEKALMKSKVLKTIAAGVTG
jgi:hypothetical protein